MTYRMNSPFPPNSGPVESLLLSRSNFIFCLHRAAIEGDKLHVNDVTAGDLQPSP